MFNTNYFFCLLQREKVFNMLLVPKLVSDYPIIDFSSRYLKNRVSVPRTKYPSQNTFLIFVHTIENPKTVRTFFYPLARIGSCILGTGPWNQITGSWNQIFGSWNRIASAWNRIPGFENRFLQCRNQFLESDNRFRDSVIRFLEKDTWFRKSVSAFQEPVPENGYSVPRNGLHILEVGSWYRIPDSKNRFVEPLLDISSRRVFPDPIQKSYKKVSKILTKIMMQEIYCSLLQNKLTKNLTQYGPAIFSKTGVSGIERICKLNKCISLMHGNSWKQEKYILINCKILKHLLNVVTCVSASKSNTSNLIIIIIIQFGIDSNTWCGRKVM